MLTDLSATPLPRMLRWTLWTAVSLILVVVVGFAYVTFVGITINASALRGPVAKVFTENLGRVVRFEGPMELEISARPKLRVGGLQIANAPGFDGNFASLGEARLALNLFLLLRRQLQIEEFSGRDVQVRLQSRADGSNNWRFRLAKAGQPDNPLPAATPQKESISVGRVLALLDIQRVVLERLKVEYVGANGSSHYFDLHTLTTRSRTGEPFTLTVNGTVEKTFPYKVDFKGGLLSELAQTGKPWPVSSTLTFLSSTLNMNGSVSGASGEIHFGLGTETLTEFERLFQTRLPQVGAAGIGGTLSFRPGHVSLQQIGASMGSTSLIGSLEFDYGGARPLISGSLSLPTLDLRPFLMDKPEATFASPPSSLADTYRELSKVTFSLSELNRANVNLNLSVGRWLSLPGDVRDATLRVKLDNGRLETPLRATVAGVTLAGSATADATATPPKFRLAVGTRDSDLGGLAELLVGAKGIKGQLRRFDLRVVAEGDRVSELVQSLDVRLDIERGRLSYGNFEGGRPVDFTLEKLSVAVPAGKALAGEIRGSLLGNPLIARLGGGALEAMMLGNRTPVEFSARSGSVRVNLRGILERPSTSHGPDLVFDVSADNAGDVASWFGLQAGARARVSFTGKASIRSEEWRLADIVFQLGSTRLAADLARTGIGAQALVKVRLVAEQLDVAELESLLPKSEKTEGSGPVLDIPVLPKGIDLSDADVDIRLQRLLNSPLDVRNVSFAGRIREGYMHPSQFAADVADTRFSGAILLDLRGEEPNAGLWLFANNANVGDLLRKLNLVRDLDARLDLMQIYLATRSTRLGDLIARADLTANFEGGRVTLRDANTGAQARIALESGLLRAAPGEKVRLDLKGSLDDTPVRIGVETAPALDLVNPQLRVPFTLSSEAAETRVTLSGSIARPLGNKDIELALDAQGTRFDSLDKLARASLPPWGPWSAAGRFRLSQRGYEVADLRLQVGQSVLNGQGKLDTSLPRPRIDVSLAAPSIQLDDFRFGNWSPVEKRPEPEKALTAEDIRTKAAEASDRAQRLLSPEVLRRQDAYLAVRVDQVLSGQDTLGSGKLEAKLENGRADVGPIEVDIPGGSAKLSLGYEPTDQDVKVDLRMDVDKFDYGILARRIKPGTDLQGNFSLKVDVNSRAKYLSETLRHGSGGIEFSVWPKNMQSGIFDLWAVNVLLALVPAVDPGKASKVNCAIGRFDLNDGKLVDKAILLDTSRMRVTGKGSADFGEEILNLKMRPQAKTAQFLSLATPIQVSGTFNNFKIGVSPGDMIETVGRLATSIIWVPLQKIAGKKIPADGSDICFASVDDSAK